MCSGASLPFFELLQAIQAIQILINTFLRAYQGSFCESSLVSIVDARVLTVCLDRFIGGALPGSITTFESALFPIFTEILQGDIDRASRYLLSICLFFYKGSDKTTCCRIYTIHFPDPGTNAYTAQGRTG
jgi:hypothetical protein